MASHLATTSRSKCVFFRSQVLVAAACRPKIGCRRQRIQQHAEAAKKEKQLDLDTKSFSEVTELLLLLLLLLLPEAREAVVGFRGQVVVRELL
jgi:hypothetical protein